MGKLRHRARQVVRAARRSRSRAVHSAVAVPTPPAPAAGAASAAGQEPAPRVEALPVLEPLPPYRYVFLVDGIPRKFGGRTASILNKCRLLKQVGGVDSMIVTMNHAPQLDQLAADLRRRGLLVDGVQLVNLHDYVEDESVAPFEPVRHSVEQPGLASIRDATDEVYRYFENGVYRLYQRFDDEGRLLVRDWFDESRARTRRDEFRPNGTIRRTCYMDPQHNRPRQEVYFRRDGTPSLNKWLVLDPETLVGSVERVTLMDAEGRPKRAHASQTPLIHRCLDRLLGDERVFLSVEARPCDEDTLTFRRPNVKRIYPLHSSHLVAPGRDRAALLPAYRPLLRRRAEVDAVVFLTEEQRHDAERQLGEHAGFRVIPHPMRRALASTPESRDPNLVVLVARLLPLKRVAHAVTAFASVVAAVPSARLEIWGEGPERARLEALVDELDLGFAVKLMGYTEDPDPVYRRASLSLLTSEYEGFGLVLLESLANGCPVVSYDIRYGPPDVLTDGVNGFLVPSGDTAALAQRVTQVLTDDQVRRRLEEGAASGDPRFSEEVVVARWSQLFRELDAEGWGETPGAPSG